MEKKYEIMKSFFQITYTLHSALPFVIPVIRNFRDCRNKKWNVSFHHFLSRSLETVIFDLLAQEKGQIAAAAETLFALSNHSEIKRKKNVLNVPFHSILKSCIDSADLQLTTLEGLVAERLFFFFSSIFLKLYFGKWLCFPVAFEEKVRYETRSNIRESRNPKNRGKVLRKQT